MPYKTSVVIITSFFGRKSETMYGENFPDIIVWKNWVKWIQLGMKNAMEWKVPGTKARPEVTPMRPKKWFQSSGSLARSSWLWRGRLHWWWSVGWNRPSTRWRRCSDQIRQSIAKAFRPAENHGTACHSSNADCSLEKCTFCLICAIVRWHSLTILKFCNKGAIKKREHTSKTRTGHNLPLTLDQKNCQVGWVTSNDHTEYLKGDGQEGHLLPLCPSSLRVLGLQTESCCCLTYMMGHGPDSIKKLINFAFISIQDLF